MVMVTLLDIVAEKGMTPSRAATNKGCRNERELLRYKAHIGVIFRKKKWEWEERDPELHIVRGILEKFKNGERAPSNWRKLPETPKDENEAALPDEPPPSSREAMSRPNSNRDRIDSTSTVQRKKQKIRHHNHNDDEAIQPLLVKPASNGTQGESTTARSAIRHPVVKFESMKQGLIKCPNCNIGIAISTGCSVATCRNHKPSYLYFCIYCKQPAPGGYSTCKCPKRADKKTRIKVLKTPIAVYDDENDDDNGNNKSGP